jgi:spermidine/putrescine transport system permease protein
MMTFPKFVYVSSARGIPPQANVIGSAMFFIALAIVIAGQVASRKRKQV